MTRKEMGRRGTELGTEGNLQQIASVLVCHGGLWALNLEDSMAERRVVPVPLSWPRLTSWCPSS